MDIQDGQKERSAQSLALASMILGIASICCCCVSPMLGGLGIVLAILSKRTNREMLTQAKAGLITSIIGVVIAIAAFFLLMIPSINAASADGGDEFWQEYEEQYERQYHQEVPEGTYETYKEMIDFLSPESEL
jgi:hypothetical protein